MYNMSTTVRAPERSWVRLSVAVLTTAGLIYGIAENAGRIDLQVYLAAVLVFLVATIFIILAYRHERVAREARARTAGKRDATVMLLVRAILFEPGSNEILCGFEKGWVVITEDGVAIWEAGKSAPIAVYSLAGTSVESVGGSFYAHAIARFRFGDGSRFDAAVVRGGFADLNGWSARQISGWNDKFSSAG